MRVPTFGVGCSLFFGRTFRETIGTGLKVGFSQTLRVSTWVCAASLIASLTQEVLEVGPHFYKAAPTQDQKLVFEGTNATGGALAGLLTSVGKDPTTALMSRQGRVLTRPQLRVAYTALGALAGMYLPGVLGSLTNAFPRRVPT